MKGPFERLKYDLRRLWECPRCKRRERTDGHVTFRFCTCKGGGEGDRTPMKLLEEAGHRSTPVIKYRPPEEISGETSGEPPPTVSVPEEPVREGSSEPDNRESPQTGSI